MTMTAKKIQLISLANLVISAAEGGIYTNEITDAFRHIKPLADYILANVPEDGEEGIEKSEIECYLEIVHEDNDGYWTSATKELWFRPNSASLYIPFTTTRSQFRSLMKGLGIEPKNKSQETNKCYICGNVIEYGECECTDD